MIQSTSYFSKWFFMAVWLLSFNVCYAQRLSIYDSLAVIPPFRYYQLNGLVFTSDSLAQRKQATMIYFKKNCPYCEKQGEIVSKHIDDFPDAEFVFISKEDTAFIRDYKVRHKLGSERIIFVQDKERLYYRYCNASYTPSIHIYNKKRKLILFHEGVLDAEEILNYYAK